ncbi:uncharacterized protein BDV17DRAFT_151686 [Aspergillus undulatus]|uniref:uncharacterized protein n=1 Tax=Aspergillus undulatus TaxID=1810928 RepID=UPI003CCD2E23
MWGLHMTAVSMLIKESRLSPSELDGGVINLIQWVESIGCYAFDILPALNRLRKQKIPSIFPHILNPYLIAWRPSACLYPSAPAFKLYGGFNAQLCRRTTTLGESVWRNPVEIDEIIHPLTDQFLLELHNSDSSPISSGVRSAVLLYLAEFRRTSGISPVVTDVHLQRLCGSMDAVERAANPAINPDLTLWLLTVGALEANPSRNCHYFYSRLSPAFRALGIDSRPLWKQHLQAVAWFDYLFESKLHAIWVSCQQSRLARPP